MENAGSEKLRKFQEVSVLFSNIDITGVEVTQEREGVRKEVKNKKMNHLSGVISQWGPDMCLWSHTQKWRSTRHDIAQNPPTPRNHIIAPLVSNHITAKEFSLCAYMFSHCILGTVVLAGMYLLENKCHPKFTGRSISTIPLYIFTGEVLMIPD